MAVMMNLHSKNNNRHRHVYDDNDAHRILVCSSTTNQKIE